MDNNNGRLWKKLQEKFRRKISLYQQHLKWKTELYLIKMLLLNNLILLFTNIGPNLANKIPQISNIWSAFFSCWYSINHHDLTLILREFETAYKSLKRNKAFGIDDINNIVLDFFQELKTPLFYIFQALLRETVFPDKMKIVLPVFSKTEKIMYNRVYNYFAENKFLFPKQFGFQINTSTEHAILELMHNITKSFEKKWIYVRSFHRS